MKALKPPYLDLRPYQEEAVDFLCNTPFAGLFIDMGLGKTAIALHAFLEFPKPILLVGPINVIETVWMKEAQLWLATRGLTFTVLRGTPAQRAEVAKRETDVYLVNPELLEEALELRDDYRVLFIDESSLFKNPSSKRFKILRKSLGRFERRIIATGTPAPNSLMDLWSQVFILDRGEALGSAFNRFKQKYFYQTDWQGYSFAAHDWAEEKIVELISPHVFQLDLEGAGLTKREVIPNVLYLDLPAPARKAYAEMEKEKLTELLKSGGTITAATAAIATMKLRQLASGFVYDEDGKVHEVHKAKIEAVGRIRQETGSPVILVYQFQHELAALQKAFPDGVKFQPELETKWNKGKIPLLFLHPQSGGHGLNLQFGGHTMIVFSGSYSYEQMTQVLKRIDRSGQPSPFIITHYLVARDTIDELLLSVVQNKHDKEKNLLNAIKGYALERMKRK